MGSVNAVFESINLVMRRLTLKEMVLVAGAVRRRCTMAGGYDLLKDWVIY